MVALNRLAMHLDMLAGRVFDVEHALGHTLANAQSTDDVPFTKLQSLDFTRQSLEDCALMLHLLSQEGMLETNPHRSLYAISQRLKLEATKRLLRNNEQPNSAEAGHFDLF